MLIELVGGPSDGDVFDADSPPQPAIHVPPDIRHPRATYRLTVRSVPGGAAWVYVFGEQYGQLVKRWR